MNDRPYGFADRTACPVCGADGAKTELLHSVPFGSGGIGAFVRDYYRIDPASLAAAPYELRRCADCTLVYQRFVGDAHLLSDLYTHWVDEPDDPDLLPEYRSELAHIPQSRDAHELMAAAAFLGVPLADLVTLDYGMGWALWARIAASLGCASYGSDLACPRMEFARRNGVRTLEDHEIGRHRFHFINTEQVFEHVPEPRLLATRLAESLLPGGILKISVPSGENAAALAAEVKGGRYGGNYPTIVPIQPLEHVNSFTRRSVLRLAREAGLEPVRPSLAQRYAFLRYKGTLGTTRPRKVAKEMVRPVYQYRNRANLYEWFRRPA